MLKHLGQQVAKHTKNLKKINNLYRIAPREKGLLGPIIVTNFKYTKTAIKNWEIGYERP